MKKKKKEERNNVKKRTAQSGKYQNIRGERKLQILENMISEHHEENS